MNAAPSVALTSAERLGPVGFGAAPIGNLYRPVSDAAARAALEAAWEGGIRYYDTAPHYGLGLSERRLGIARRAVGPGFPIAIDANQRWDVEDAVAWVNALDEFEPAWIEEPTSPDDVLGHAEIARGVAPIRVATGEHAQNRVIFKQLLQAEAISVMQIDAVRVAGVNENIANLLLAAKFGVPVCPHAGGVGLCEAVQHLSMFDFVAVTGTREGRMIEFVDHLHEHFATPTVVARGRYLVPTAAGAGTEMLADSVDAYTWRGAHAGATA